MSESNICLEEISSTMGKTTSTWAWTDHVDGEPACQIESCCSKPGAKRPFLKHVIAGPGVFSITDASELLVIPNLLPSAVASDLLSELREHLSSFTRPAILVYGRRVPIPRDQIAFGEGVYRYSGVEIAAHPPPPHIDAFLDAMRTVTGEQAFRFVLVNHYADGTDKIGRHSDDERGLVPGVPILSYTLDAERRFIVRPKKRPDQSECADQKKRKRVSDSFVIDRRFLPESCFPDRLDLRGIKYSQISFEILSGHNMLIGMCRNFQKEFDHEVPATSAGVGCRFNMTLRAVR
jgi:alkylated DNA repair dioxygenase AlkB